MKQWEFVIGLLVIMCMVFFSMGCEGVGDGEVELQAEEDMGLNDASVETEYSGYTGTGYVDFNDTSGSSMTWTIDTPVSGNYYLTFKYANGSTRSKYMTVKVNGVIRLYGLMFFQTGSYETWSQSTSTIYLSAGTTEFEVVSIDSYGGPNMDKVIITGDF